MTAKFEPGFSLAELAMRTGASLEGDGSIIVRRVGTLEHAERDAIAFLANPRYRAQLAVTRAGAVIVAPADVQATPLPKLVSSEPYVVYAKVAVLLHPDPAEAP